MTEMNERGGIKHLCTLCKRSGMLWHPVGECLQCKTSSEAALCSVDSFNMSRNLGVELCNSVTAFCVELYCDEKVTYYFPCFKEKYFCL